MPIWRRRGGTATPFAGAETSRPPMLISPAVRCSRPATQRSVVVLPQPEGPSSTTISPLGTWKLTPSTAGRPAENSLRSSRTSRAADIRRSGSPASRSPDERQRNPGSSPAARSPRISPACAGVMRATVSYGLLPIAVGLVPLLDPGRVQLHVLIEIRQPDLDHLGIEA